MRLLSITLPLLLLASSSLAGPTDRRTTIEIVSETVTRTVVHNVTEAPPKKCNNCCCDYDEPTTTTTTPEPDCNCEPETTTPAPTTEEPCDCEEPTTTTTEAPTPASDCPCRRKSARQPEETTIRQCSCKESEQCRAESSKAVDVCMEQCEEELQTFGTETSGYLSCFKKNPNSITEAETCLFKDVKCNNETAENTVDKANWEELTSIKYEGKADEALKNNKIWERDQPKYDKIQTFFHCTKHCMQQKYYDCTTEKKCGAAMPSANDFADKMVKCTKENPKIATAIFNACYCMAWSKGVKELQGSCVVVGNKFYIDKA